MTRRAAGRPSGDIGVRSALLESALELLQQPGGQKEVTISAVTRAAGCTPPSLYHYWRTREDLLAEASALGFQRFRESQRADLDPSGDSLSRLRQRGHAYLRFALDHPALFRVLFIDSPVAGPAAAAAMPGEGLRDLIADVTEAMARGWLRTGDPMETAVALWAGVHGVAALWVNSPELPDQLAHHVAELQSDALLRGLAPAAE